MVHVASQARCCVQHCVLSVSLLCCCWCCCSADRRRNEGPTNPAKQRRHIKRQVSEKWRRHVTDHVLRDVASFTLSLSLSLIVRSAQRDKRYGLPTFVDESTGRKSDTVTVRVNKQQFLDVSSPECTDIRTTLIKYCYHVIYSKASECSIIILLLCKLYGIQPRLPILAVLLRVELVLSPTERCIALSYRWK